MEIVGAGLVPVLSKATTRAAPTRWADVHTERVRRGFTIGVELNLSRHRGRVHRLCLIRPSLSVVLAAILLAACSSARNSNRQQAEQYLAEKKLPEAVLAYRQALKADPQDPQLLRGLGMALAAQGRDRTAATALSQAADSLPEDPDLHKTLAALTTAPEEGLGLKRAWFYDGGGIEPVGAAVAAGRVFIAYAGAHMLVLEQASGRILWHVGAQASFVSPPAADAQQVWIGAEDGSVSVYDAITGEARGSYRTGGAVYAAPALGSDTVYCASSDGTLYAIDRGSLALRWKAALGDPLHASPLVSGDAVYVGSNNGRLYAFNASNGERLWPGSYLTQGAVESQPALDNGRIFFGSGDGRLYALDTATGAEAWHFSMPDAVYATPLIVNGQVIAASSGQMLASVGAADGKPAWSLPFDHALAQRPALFNDRLYLAARGDPRLFSVDPQTGKLLGELDTGDWIAFGPFANGSDLLLVGQDGSVFLYR